MEGVGVVVGRVGGCIEVWLREVTAVVLGCGRGSF